jgi:hypothetical protein
MTGASRKRGRGFQVATVMGPILLISAAMWGAEIQIMDPSRLELNNANVESVTYHGQRPSR